MAKENPVEWFKDRFKVEYLKVLDADGKTEIIMDAVSCSMDPDTIYILTDDAMLIIPRKRLLEMKVTGGYMEDLCNLNMMALKLQYPKIFAVKKGPGAEVG